MNRTLATAALAIALLPVAADADTVRLRGAVRLPSGATHVRLADVALLEGAEAQRFADLVVAEAPRGDRPLELAVGEVRRALADAGALWSAVDLTGRRVIVRGRPSIACAAPSANDGLAIGSASARPDDADAASSDRILDADGLVLERTLRGMIARTIASGLDRDPSDLRLACRSSDAEWLGGVGDERDFRLERDSGFAGPRVAFRVSRTVDGRVEDERTIVVRPLVRTIVHLPVDTVASGEPLASESFVAEERWLAPLHAAGLAADAPDRDAVATRTLKAGSPVRTRDIGAPEVVARGDLVTVQCVVGSIEITFEAEALDAGAEGAVISVRRPGERDRLHAVVLGPGSVAIEPGRTAHLERPS